MAIIPDSFKKLVTASLCTNLVIFFILHPVASVISSIGMFGRVLEMEKFRTALSYSESLVTVIRLSLHTLDVLVARNWV
jgi:hypothetical protein